MGFRIGKLQQRLKSQGTAFEDYAPIFRQALLDVTLANESRSALQMAEWGTALLESSKRLESVRPADNDLSDLHLRLIGLCRASALEVTNTFAALTFPVNPYVHTERAREYQQLMSTAEQWSRAREKIGPLFVEDADRLEKANPELFRRLDLEGVVEQAASILRREASELSESKTQPGELRANDI